MDEIGREEKKLTKRDFYKILEIKKDTTQEEIRKSYKKLASKWHPDKNTESEEMKEYADIKFKDINEAYTILSDERKRRIYDQGEHPDNPNSSFHTDFKNQEQTCEETFQYYSTTFKDNREGHHKSQSKYDQHSYSSQYQSKKKQKRDSKY